MTNLAVSGTLNATLGTGSTLTYTTGGEINANYALGLVLPTLTTGYLQYTGSAFAWGNPTGTGGTVTTITVGNLSPLFTTSVATPSSTPAVTFTLANAAAHTLYGNSSGSTAAPTFGYTVGSAASNIPQLDASSNLIENLKSNGNTVVLSSGGITATDTNTNVLSMTATGVNLAFGPGTTAGEGVLSLGKTQNSAGGYAVDLNDNTGNGLILGNGYSVNTANINLSNLTISSGFVNTSGGTTYVYGNPLYLGVNAISGGSRTRR